MSNTRTIALLVFIGCAVLMAVALYMQHVLGLNPCYLCITQRAFVIAIGVTALAFAVQQPAAGTGHKIYSGLLILLAGGGSFFSGKQLWLQSLPEDKVPACGPPADYLFEMFNFSEALAMLLQGDGNCAEVQWTLLGLSIPGWTLLAFSAFFLAAAWLFFKKS